MIEGPLSSLGIKSTPGQSRGLEVGVEGLGLLHLRLESEERVAFFFLDLGLGSRLFIRVEAIEIWGGGRALSSSHFVAAEALR